MLTGWSHSSPVAVSMTHEIGGNTLNNLNVSVANDVYENESLDSTFV